MKKLTPLVFLGLLASKIFAQTTTTNDHPAFNPQIKFHGLVQTRYEASLTDSIDASGAFNPNPIKSNLRVRRAELRGDISLNDHWSGVIRIQFPELKGTYPGRAIELAYFNYKHSDELEVRGGVFKAPFEWDEMSSHAELPMVDHGPTDRMFQTGYYSSYQPGLMATGTFMKSTTTPLTYYAAVVTGGERGMNFDNTYGKNPIARIEYTPVKGLRLAINGEIAPISKSVTGHAYEGDIVLKEKFSDLMNIWIETEYVNGTNISTFKVDTSESKDVSNFKMDGYYALGLLRFELNKPWCKTLEIGGRYEWTDPNTSISDNAYTTIVGNIGFVILPENDVRIQLNIVQTNYQKEIPGTSTKNNLAFVAQLQLKM
ncbi:MAG: porin [Chitinophagales bacterium]